MKKMPACCGHEMKRIYTPNGVIFKGKGFYKTGG
jgi:predicted nucleic acid-binding Zn ribbon protein